jgi:DNA-binding NtrC family response regulator
VATIVIAEPQEDVRELFAHVLRRLGHDPVDPSTVELDGDRPAAAVDLLLFEPADRGAMRLAQRLRAERPELPLICASIFPRTAEARALKPVAFLEKPFDLAELEAAVARAVASA